MSVQLRRRAGKELYQTEVKKTCSYNGAVDYNGARMGCKPANGVNGEE